MRQNKKKILSSLFLSVSSSSSAVSHKDANWASRGGDPCPCRGVGVQLTAPTRELPASPGNVHWLSSETARHGRAEKREGGKGGQQRANKHTDRRETEQQAEQWHCQAQHRILWAHNKHHFSWSNIEGFFEDFQRVQFCFRSRKMQADKWRQLQSDTLSSQSRSHYSVTKDWRCF